MGWGRLDDPSWWWQYALDGIVGGLAGAVLAGLAAGWVFRSTVRADRSARLDAEARVAVSRFAQLVLAESENVPRSEAGRERVRRWAISLDAEAAGTYAFVWPRADLVAQDVLAANRRLKTLVDASGDQQLVLPREEIRRLLRGLGLALHAWLAKPAEYGDSDPRLALLRRLEESAPH